MSALALLPDAGPLTTIAGLRLRGRRLLAQPAVRRALPGLAALLVLVVGVGIWLAFRAPDYRPVSPQLAEGDKAAVLAALQTGNFRVRVDPTTGGIEVPDDQIAAARIMLAGQGLPKAAASGYEMLGTMPLGSSRAVETARLKQAQESELAASIMAIEGVEQASVHLAVGDVSVFVRDHAAPSASVFVRLASGRTLSQGQVRAIIHLVGSSVSGLAPDHVSVVDQSGTLLSGDADGGLFGERGQQLGFQATVEDQFRRRVVALLTPILGTGNFSTQVSADLDFSVSEATRESYDKDGAMLRSDQGTTVTDAVLPPARGIPGALSNTVPPAAQIALTPPVAVAPPGPGATRSDSFTRSFELAKAVSVTRAPVGQLRRLSVAVVVRTASLGAAKGQAAEVALLTTLVRGAVGFDTRRGDVVIVAGQAFVAAPGDPVQSWWELSLVRTAAIGTMLLVGLAVVAFGVIRPLLKRPAEPASATLSDDPEQGTIGVDYTVKLAETKLLVSQDIGRASAVVRQMMRADAA